MADLSDKYLALIGKRKLYPPLNSYSAFLQGSEYNIGKYYEKWYNSTVKLDWFAYMKAGFSQVWLPDDDLMQGSFFAFKEYLRDSQFFNRRIAYLNESTKKIDKIYQEYTYEKINQTDWETLFKLINEIRDIIWDVNAAVMFTIYVDKKICADILAEANYPLPAEELDALWERATEPAFESFDKSQFSDFLTLTKAGKSWSEIVEACQYFLTDYHSARTLAEVEVALKERYADCLNNPIEATTQLTAETEEVAGVVAAHQKWLSSLPQSERVIAEYLQLTMKTRDRRKNFFAKGMTIMYRVAERMFKETGLDRELIPYYTVRELLRGVDYLRSNRENLIDRPNGFQWLIPAVGEPEGLNTNIDEGATKINKYFKDSHLSAGAASAIKGQVAFKGVVQGRVRIVLDVRSDHGFAEGEILVAGMTRPEYVPLMKKAAAIVTDEGGITCHAAIVSRELRIPCVIGTKIATRVLKDGDMVEVDADKGIVTIL